MKAQMLNTHSDNTMLHVNRLDVLHKEASDFGSSDGTNVQMNYPTGIHELISPHATLHTKNFLLRNKQVHTTKNFEYSVRADNLLGESTRNNLEIVERRSSLKSSSKKAALKTQQSPEKKRTFNGTQKVSMIPC